MGLYVVPVAILIVSVAVLIWTSFFWKNSSRESVDVNKPVIPCICNKSCICENPPKKGEERKVWHKISQNCPIHASYDVNPDPNCKAESHGPFDLA